MSRLSEKMSQRPKSNAPKDASMTLLNEVMNRPLDPGYAVAAQAKRAREQRGETAESRWVRGLLLLLAVVLGFTTISAVLSLRSREDVATSARTLLREEIVDRSTSMEALEAEITELSVTAQQLQDSALSNSSLEITPEEQRDLIVNGAVPVVGPGISVRLDDGPNVDELRDNRVRDVDVRGVVSALWSAGAEAVAVNGKRLTPTSAIRSAGDAILVDLSGLSAPYLIEAIGDQAGMEVSFVKNPITQDLLELEVRYGIKTTVSRVSELHLNAGTTKKLLFAEVPID